MFGVYESGGLINQSTVMKSAPDGFMVYVPTANPDSKINDNR